MGVGAPGDGGVEHAGRGEVVGEDERSLDLVDSLEARLPRRPDRSPRRRRRGRARRRARPCRSCAVPLTGRLRGSSRSPCTGRCCGADPRGLSSRRVRWCPAEGLCGHDEPRGAEAALYGARGEEGRLDGVQVARRGKSLDGLDGRPSSRASGHRHARAAARRQAPCRPRSDRCRSPPWSLSTRPRHEGTAPGSPRWRRPPSPAGRSVENGPHLWRAAPSPLPTKVAGPLPRGPPPLSDRNAGARTATRPRTGCSTP